MERVTFNASLSKIDVTPAQTEEFALAQAGRRSNENQCSFSKRKTVRQGLISAGVSTLGAVWRFAL